MSNSLIRVNNLKKSFGGLKAVDIDDLNFKSNEKVYKTLNIELRNCKRLKTRKRREGRAVKRKRGKGLVYYKGKILNQTDM